MNNKILIATAIYNGDFFKDKEILSLDKSAEIQVTTTTKPQSVNFDFETIYSNKILFYSIIVLILLLLVLTIQIIFNKKKESNSPLKEQKVSKRTKSNKANLIENQEQKIKMNYATPNNLNSCIRMFLERTKHK